MPLSIFSAVIATLVMAETWMWGSVGAALVPSAVNRWTMAQAATNVPPAPYQAVTVAYKGDLWLFGGSGTVASGDVTSFSASRELWRLSMSASAWINETQTTQDQAMWPPGRMGHVGCLLEVTDGIYALFISGGVTTSPAAPDVEEFLQDTWLYFFHNASWLQSVNVSTPLASASGTCINGKVIVFGGMASSVSPEGERVVGLSNATYIFDPLQNVWEYAIPYNDSVPSARWGGAMFSNGSSIYLQGGCETVADGRSNSLTWAAAEAGTWSLTVQEGHALWRRLNTSIDVGPGILTAITILEPTMPVAMMFGGFGKDG